MDSGSYGTDILAPCCTLMIILILYLHTNIHSVFQKNIYIYALNKSSTLNNLEKEDISSKVYIGTNLLHLQPIKVLVTGTEMWKRRPN